jgi:hypothetical protein
MGWDDGAVQSVDGAATVSHYALYAPQDIEAPHHTSTPCTARTPGSAL